MLIKKSLKYEVFPGGQPSRYYPHPTGFDFGDRTSPGFFFFFFSEKAQKSFLFTIKKYYGFSCRLSIYSDKLF